MQLTSLAAVKRACAVGAHLQLVATDVPHLQRTMEQPPRPIARAQTNAIALRGVHRNGGKEYDTEALGWIYWPKARDITPHGDATFTLDWGGGTATYRVIP